MPAAVVAPGLFGRGGGGVRGVSVLRQVDGACVLHLGGVHYVLAVVGQLDVGLDHKCLIRYLQNTAKITVQKDKDIFWIRTMVAANA